MQGSIVNKSREFSIEVGGYLIEMTLELSGINTKTPRFSIMGSIHYPDGDECGGQCQDEIDKIITKKNEHFLNWKIIKYWWDNYHLNDMHAGTEEQEKLTKGLDYSLACEILKLYGLYEVTLPTGEVYKYGHKWLYREIPERDYRKMIRFITTETKEN